MEECDDSWVGGVAAVAVTATAKCTKTTQSHVAGIMRMCAVGGEQQPRIENLNR